MAKWFLPDYNLGKSLIRFNQRIPGFKDPVKLQKTIESTKHSDAIKAYRELEIEAHSRSLKTFSKCVVHYRKHHKNSGMESYLNELERRFDVAVDDSFKTKYTDFIYSLNSANSVRTGKPLTAETINKYKAAIRAVLNFSYHSGFITALPAIKYDISRAAHRERILSSDERLRLLNTARIENSYLYPLIYFRLHNKARLSDLLILKTDSWNAHQKIIKFYPSKTSARQKNKRPTICGIIDDYLFEYLNSLPIGAYLFHAADPYKPLPDFRSHFHTLLKHAGIQNYRFKDMEHDALTHFKRIGGTKELAAKCNIATHCWDVYENSDVMEDLDKLRGSFGGRSTFNKVAEA